MHSTHVKSMSPSFQIIKEIKETIGPQWGWNMWNLSSYHLPAQIQQQKH